MVNSPSTSNSPKPPPNGKIAKGMAQSSSTIAQRTIKWVRTRIQLFTTSDWVMAALWISTFLMMFVFIGVNADKSLSAGDHVTAVAVTAGIFALLLCTSIVTMVVFKYLRVRAESGKV